MYWDWITAANTVQGTPRAERTGPAVQWERTAARYVTFTFADGECTTRSVSDERPGATFVLAGDYAAWKDIAEGYDAGKAVMYRRLRLEEGDVFRFFNRVYLFTESLVATVEGPSGRSRPEPLRA